MQVEDLDILGLFEVDAGRGLIQFAGSRTVAVDASALGILRKELVTRLGLEATRTVFTRFGFVHGWRLAEALEARFPWEPPGELARAGARVPMLEGMYRLAPGSGHFLSPEGVTALGSCEAEQHLAHLGPAETSVCWTVCGLASGYLSRVLGQEIFVLEDRCAGRGDAECRLVGRTRAGWGPDREEELRCFHGGEEGAWRERPRARSGADPGRSRERKPAAAPPGDGALGLTARSGPIRHLIDLAQRIAAVDSTVLISGESGTGKERVARLVHRASPRAEGPFIAVNCGAITETLLESELFGHVRGAFTGAQQERAGLFEAANGGTLLLDEVGEVSPAMQVKLLRVLQEREVRRVGDSLSRPIDVRVIAATNRDLAQELAEGRFRQDLYYRLKVVELHVPPLRERREDILPLARTLLAEAAARLGRPASTLSAAAADQLLRYDWPGNVRELENAMERAVALAQGPETELEDLPEEVRRAIPGCVPSLRAPIQRLQDVERDYILAVLAFNGGNQTRTAEQLGLGTATLYRKLRSYRKGCAPDA